jgi:hypothetical protein
MVAKSKYLDGRILIPEIAGFEDCPRRAGAQTIA